MAIVPKILSQGFISSSRESIYTVPLDVNATYVKLFSVYNVGATTQDIVINVSGSITTTLARVQLAPSESAHIIDKDSVLMIQSTNSVDAVTTSNDSIQYTLSGGTE